MKCETITDNPEYPDKTEVGRFGENVACVYYEKEGFEIIDRNFNCNAGEIDIVAKKKDKLVFIEVKSRINFETIKPFEAVDKSKRFKIIKTAKYYLKTRSIKLSDYYMRFDIANIFIKKFPTDYTIEIFKNAYDEKGKLI